MSKLISAYNDHTLYFTPRSELHGKDKFWIYTYNTESQVQDSIEIRLTKKTKSLFARRVFCMEVVRDHLILINDENVYVYVFSLTKGKSELEYTLPFERFYNALYKLNDHELLLYVNYNFHPGDSKDKHVWAKLNLLTKSITPFKKMDDGNVRFSSLANSWISVYKGLIAYTQTTDYRIRLYDADFNLNDSIVSDKLESNKAGLSKLKPFEYSRDEVIKLMKLDDTCLTRIQKIFLLDSTHLLVMLKLPKTYQCAFDLWKKTATGWVLTKNERLAGFYEAGKKYTVENQPTQGLFGNMIGISYGNHTFFTVYSPFMEDIITETFDRKKDYEETSNNMVRKGDLFYGIRNYKVLVD